MGPRRWLWSLAAAFAAVAGLTLLLRGGRWVVAHLGGGTGAAQWIWVAHDRRQTQPLAFYAARDFTLASPPPARARLLALGDPEYVLYLNGKRVGAGGWRPGARLDEYEVGPLLRPGGNRLLAELRSADGAGGFLASLVEAASGRALVGTDGAWRIFPRHRLGLLRGWLPADPASAAMLASAAGPGEAAICWGRPPVGRWGRVLPAAPRPLFAELTGGRRPLPAAAATPYVPPPATGVAGDSSMELFDWGCEVTGYLALEPGFAPGMDSDLVAPPPPRQRTALLWTGDTPPQPAGTSRPPSGTVVVMASAHQWLDARLRRFRYALVIGLEQPLAARVYAVDPGVAARFGLAPAAELDGAGAGAGNGAARGVFGLPPPRLRTPVEDEIRRKLKRLEGVAGRKQL
ncbi:MAG TPA: hypothetical protein VKY89_05385 [Thermoanaerobaculia bacterium]|jgi:hypothetical protein|nr:hypothetical protein [Thermoanaerobaculia bacterium]